MKINRTVLSLICLAILTVPLAIAATNPQPDPNLQACMNAWQGSQASRTCDPPEITLINDPANYPASWCNFEATCVAQGGQFKGYKYHQKIQCGPAGPATMHNCIDIGEGYCHITCGKCHQ